jgi:two-component sensor histidine kinase
MAATASEVLIALPPRPESARLARRALQEKGLAEDLDHTVTLLTTEIVANALKHGDVGPDDRITLFASMTPDHVRVEVHDPGRGFDPDVRHQTKGFGLRLVDKLASRWGVERAAGCRVWFEVDQRRRFDRG